MNKLTCYSPNVIKLAKSKRLRLARYAARMVEEYTQGIHVIQVYEDIIKIYFSEIDEALWTELIRLRDQWRTIVNTIMNLRAPY
jgi:hypothetical protein